jgi:glutamyl-tRNA reductase
MGQLAARAAKEVGASVAIASRSEDRAREVSAEIEAIPLPFDPGDRIDGFSGIVVALAGPWSISRPTMNAITRGPATLVDLSVPAALPIELRQAIGPRLIEADDLARDDMAADVLPERWLARLDALIDATATEFIEWLDQRASRSAANALVERAEREREAELVALARRLPELEPEALEAIDAMTRHLAARLLREPLERLGRDSDGQAERAVREIFAL